MNAHAHLSDDLLEQIIADDQFDTNTEGIDTHIDSCAECRARLEALAADGDWLNQYRDRLASNYDRTDSSLVHSFESTRVRRTDSDFNRKAIEEMLRELLEPAIHPETLGRLGRYEVESIIGYGGMGVVLRAYDRNLQRPVAIKLIVPRHAGDGTAKQRFTREARAAATVLHPGVISIHCIDSTNDVPWFVMPLIDGPSLQESVEQAGPLPEADIVRIGQQIASGLAAAHSHGLVHRDIKPANILVDNHVNRVVITDFGLARHDTDTLITQAGILAGTLHYMSPEQTRGEELDGRSDLFSLGSLLYFLATGSVPFRSDTPVGALHKIANEQHKDVRRLNPEISKTLSSAIDTLLAKDRSERFQSASEVEQFFSNLVAHLNQPTQYAAPTVPMRKKRSTVRLLLLAVPLLACTVFGIWFAMQPANNAEPTPATPNLTRTPSTSAATAWANIQNQYGFASPSAFDEEFNQLVNSVRRLNANLQETMPQESASTSNKLSNLNSELRRIANDLGE